MKYQVLFALKNNEKKFKTVVCCSHYWRLKVNQRQDTTRPVVVLLFYVHSKHLTVNQYFVHILSPVTDNCPS